MKSKDVKVKARIAKLLLSFCFVAWGVTWVYAFIADEWGLIAGFFKGLGVLSSFVVEFFFCSGLQTQCEADALNMVGFFFHSFYVIAICSVFYAIMPHASKQKSQ